MKIANKRALAACGKLVLPFEPLGINARELEYRRRRRRTQNSQTTEQNRAVDCRLNRKYCFLFTSRCRAFVTKWKAETLIHMQSGFAVFHHTTKYKSVYVLCVCRYRSIAYRQIYIQIQNWIAKIYSFIHSADVSLSFLYTCTCTVHTKDGAAIRCAGRIINQLISLMANKYRGVKLTFCLFTFLAPLGINSSTLCTLPRKITRIFGCRSSTLQTTTTTTQHRKFY